MNKRRYETINVYIYSNIIVWNKSHNFCDLFFTLDISFVISSVIESV